MRKSRRAILILLALLLVLISAALIFFYQKIDGDAKPYSEKSMRNFVLETIRSDGTSASCWFKGIRLEELRDSADAVISELFETNGIAGVCVHSVDARYISVLGHIYTTIEVQYNRLLPSELPVAETEFEAVELFLDAFGEDQTKLYIAASDNHWDEETLLGVAVSVFDNLDRCIEASYYYTQVYPEAGDDTVLYLEVEFDMSRSDRQRYDAQMDDALTVWADDIAALGITQPEELYRAIHDYLIRRVEYDYALADASLSYDDMTDAQRLGRTAYGAVIEGKTVCSGYAHAYKELCERLGLDCWVVSGDCGGPHAWNLVRLEDTVYLVDCTNDDGEGDTVYHDFFLLPERSWSRNGYVMEPHFVLPW